MQPSTINGTEIGSHEWCDALLLRYGLDPRDLPTYCDGCNAKFTICHALDCKRVGLVTASHNELRDGVADLDGKAFTPSHVRDDPFMFAGCAVKRMKAKPAGSSGTTDRDGAPPPEAMEQKGDLLIRDLWQNGTDSVHDMRVVNTDAKSHSGKTPEKFLQEAEMGVNQMYPKACLQQRRHFYLFVASVDGLLGVEATATLKILVSCLSTKWQQPYSKT